MVGTSIKIIDIFKLFLKNTNEENSNYLFDWIRKCIKDPAVNKTEISQEIINNLDRLVESGSSDRLGQKTGERHHHQVASDGREVHHFAPVLLGDAGNFRTCSSNTWPK
jgi:hypothetical protein